MNLCFSTLFVLFAYPLDKPNLWIGAVHFPIFEAIFCYKTTIFTAEVKCLEKLPQRLHKLLLNLVLVIHMLVNNYVETRLCYQNIVFIEDLVRSSSN